MSRFCLRGVLLSATLVALLLGGSARTYAATLTVSSTADTNAAGTLRTALTNAMAGDTIVFTVPASSTITLTSPLPNITVPLTINGAGSANLKIDGGGLSQMFLINTSGLVTFSALTVQNLTAAAGTGGSTVSGGIFQNSGTFLTALNIQSGGTLTGAGTSGATTVSGTIAPGVGPGNIATINTGAYVQNAGSNYNLDVNAGGQSDKIAVAGTATINGGAVNIIAAAGSYTAGTTYKILTATGGVTGEYGALDKGNLSAMLNPELFYQANEIDLILFSNFTPYANSANQKAVAATLDSIFNFGTPSAGLAAAFQALNAAGPGSLQAALNHLDGQIYGSSVAVRDQVQENWIRMLTDRIRPFGSSDDGGGDSVVPMSNKGSDGVPVRLVDDRCDDDCHSPCVGWWDGYGSRGVVGNDGNASGFDFISAGTGFGFENQLNECLLIGAAGGYANTHVSVEDAGSDLHIDGYSAAFYGRHAFDMFYELAALSYTREVFDSKRNAIIGNSSFGTAHAGYEGNAYSAYIEQGMLLCCGDGCKLQPLVAIQYINLQQDAFHETGAGALDLDVKEQKTDSLRGIAGVRLANCNGGFAAHVDARYEHEWLDDNGIVTAGFEGAPGSAFIVRGNTLGKDFGVFGGGLAWCCSENCKLTGNYEFTLSVRESSHNGIAGVEFVW